jgi:glycyl-tRNA synthetase beta chain
VVSFELAGVKSSDYTFGHRVLSKNLKLKIDSYQTYRFNLLKNNVIFDPASRKKKILEDLEQASQMSGGILIPDQALLNTVVHLNESPSVICGRFDPTYLNIPREVLITVMREHQKYFCLQDNEGKLLPFFLAVVDSLPQHHALILQGHERVLRARLADAKFFWAVDNKVPLSKRLDTLKQVVFQAKLGTLYEKSLRLVRLSTTLAKFLKKPELIPGLAMAARLAKVDLTTDMVKEFTDLQGIMGGLYARHQGLTSAVSAAIYGHYKPLFFEDSSPQTLEAAILSIADKLDSVVGAFSIGQIPTGSRDPLALRRQTLGIIKTILDYQLDFSLEKLAAKSYGLFRKYAETSLQETSKKYEAFIKERLVFTFKESGYKYDEVKAVVAVDFDNPLDCQARIQALSAMRSSQDFLALATSYKRIKNIIVKAGFTAGSSYEVDPLLFEQDEERHLHQAILKMTPMLLRLKKRKEYRRAFEMIASLRPTVNAFFDKVLVMAEQPALQQNRLGLLGSIWLLVLGMADISEIVVS